MANEKNLIPNEQRTPEERRENARKAGIASGKARREKADLRKVIQAWLSEEVALNEAGEPITGAEFMAEVAVKEMASGSAKHWELLRDTAGFKPVDRVMIADVDQAVIDQVEGMVKEAAANDSED